MVSFSQNKKKKEEKNENKSQLKFLIDIYECFMRKLHADKTFVKQICFVLQYEMKIKKKKTEKKKPNLSI